MHSDTIPPQKERLATVLDSSWVLCVQKIAAGRVKINKESSLQLHLSSIIKELGEQFCVNPDETFSIELETNYEGQSIDIFCSMANIHAAIELKCFRKSSNRAVDTDMYDVLKDITRLESYRHTSIRRFICLTDNPYYPHTRHEGHAATVSIRDDMKYATGQTIIPTWQNAWKDKSRDKALMFNQDIVFRWHQMGSWFYLHMDL